MSKVKITDEQIRQHLQEGLKQREIADKYDMLPSTLSLRIKKLREKDAREARPPQSIQPMDKLTRDFEKKDYAPVKCYIDPVLKKEQNKRRKKA